MASPIIGSATGSLHAVKLGTSVIPETSSWEADDGGTDEQDVSTGGDQGYTNTAIGAQDLRVTIELVFDLNSGPTNMALITRGTVLTNLALYTRLGDANPRYLLPSSIVTKRPFGPVAVRDKIKYKVVVKNKGPWTES